MDINRRAMLTDVLGGAAVTAVGVTILGWTVGPEIAEAAPINIAKPAGGKSDELIQRAQVVVVGPRRHRRWGRRWGRRQVCWWHRGRRVCTWR
jgi:hypothetical protein